MGYKVLLPQPILESGRAYLLERGYELVDGNGFEEEDIIRDIKGCDAMIVRTAKITRRIIAAADRLKVIARHGAGYDGVDLEAAKEKGLWFYTRPGQTANLLQSWRFFTCFTVPEISNWSRSFIRTITVLLNSISKNMNCAEKPSDSWVSAT